MSISRVMALAAAMVSIFTIVPAFAEDDPAHPAYHFEPVIIVKADASASASTASAPTASHSAAASASEPEDSQYPAANFTPRVIYPESSAK